MTQKDLMDIVAAVVKTAVKRKYLKEPEEIEEEKEQEEEDEQFYEVPFQKVTEKLKNYKLCEVNGGLVADAYNCSSDLCQALR